MAATNLAPAGQESLIPVEELTGPEPVVYCANSLDLLPTLPDASVDAIVTDPPYELGFLGKSWDASGIAYSVDLWAECLRVLKPGGHLAAFGATRTYHRMAVAVEDAGFEIRDSLHWLYGTGFPKGQDVGKLIDRRRDDHPARRRFTAEFAKLRDAAGWTNPQIDARFGFNGMAQHWTTQTKSAAVPTVEQWQRLKAEMGFEAPAALEDLVHELNGRKNAPGEAWEDREAIGKGHRARNGSGVFPQLRSDTFDMTAPATAEAARWDGWNTALKPGHEPIVLARKPLEGTVASNVLAYGTGAMNTAACRTPPDDPAGRWPTNVLLSHAWAVDEAGWLVDGCANGCAEGCPVAELDRQSGLLTSGANPRRRNADKFRDVYGDFQGQAACKVVRGADSGGASRFYPAFRYQAKAPTSERPRLPDGTVHPTVKPVALMRWLVRLLTAPGGLVLDPFAGTGTTLEAARLEGFHSVGVEAKAAYAELCRLRLRRDTAGGA
ncbi:DNA modification methylase [Streptomyces sp. LBL]|uniref:DNA-methyltransferase n=1 Tax=Streptomyces sp. LBL TaxID=2940562 RepID=UPI00247312F9|nr:DNA methyltransferase [Streptomyces sp. LBL]MDH6629399.1 DNA modification methylase [Streptomyces sp. LBL]